MKYRIITPDRKIETGMDILELIEVAETMFSGPWDTMMKDAFCDVTHVEDRDRHHYACDNVVSFLEENGCTVDEEFDLAEADIVIYRAANLITSLGGKMPELDKLYKKLERLRAIACEESDGDEACEQEGCQHCCEHEFDADEGGYCLNCEAHGSDHLNYE